MGKVRHWRHLMSGLTTDNRTSSLESGLHRVVETIGDLLRKYKVEMMHRGAKEEK